MKKIITLILALALIFTLAACKSDDGAESGTNDGGTDVVQGGDDEGGEDVTVIGGDDTQDPVDETPAAPVYNIPEVTNPDGNVIIGGTFRDEDGEIEWVRFDDHAVPFEIGVPFKAMVDLGSETNIHDEADWGYIMVVQTDLDVSEDSLDAFIYEILVDGRSVSFKEENIEVGNERGEGGIRISLTNGWSDDPVVFSPERIGEFSKLEVIMVFVDKGEAKPEL